MTCRIKPTIRRARTAAGELAPGWTLTMPPFGFGFSSSHTYPSWCAAHAALKRGVASAGSIFERHSAGYAPGLRAGRGRSMRPRWIET